MLWSGLSRNVDSSRVAVTESTGVGFRYSSGGTPQVAAHATQPRTRPPPRMRGKSETQHTQIRNLHPLCYPGLTQQPPSTGNAVWSPATANDASSAHTHTRPVLPAAFLALPHVSTHAPQQIKSCSLDPHVPLLCLPAIIIMLLRLSLRLLPPLLLSQLLLQLLVSLILQPSVVSQ